MSTLKKVISLVLCVAIAFGSFALVGGLAAPVASAEEAKNIGAKVTVKKSTDANGAQTTLTDVTGIMSYEDLVAAYGTNKGADNLTDGFLYVASEYYEADGRLTDYYVNAGDKLFVKVYVKSNMKAGDGYIISFYDNNYWDVKVVNDGGSNSTDANGYQSNFVVPSNKSHPAWTTNEYSSTVTTLNITNAGWIKNTCGFDSAYLAKTDLVQPSTATNASKSSAPYQFTSDEYLMEYYVTVKSGLADGTEISVESPDVIWQSYINPSTRKHDTRKRAYFPVGHITNAAVTSTTNAKTMASQMDSGALDYFINGLAHTFIIGTPEEEVKYAYDFYENDGATKIGETAELAVGDAVEFPAAAENQIAWAIIKSGIETPGTLITPDADGAYTYTAEAKDVAFMRVLADDKFDVELSLGANSSVDEALLPEGVTYNAEKNALVIALPVGGTFDLNTIPAEALSKKDNTFAGWDEKGVTGASSIADGVLTLGSVNGKGGTTVTAALSANWETAVYNVRFFLTKEAYENGEDPIKEDKVVAGAKYDYNIDNLVSDMKFAGWYTADTNEVVNDKKPSLGQYNFSRDMDFYANWSEYANMATFVIRDYANGEGWIEVTNDKGDAENGKTISKANLKTIKDNAVNAIGAKFVQITDMDPSLIPEGETLRDHIAVNAHPDGSFLDDLTYSGHKTFYIVTTMEYSVTWKVPVYDAEAGEFTEEYTEYPATASTSYVPTNGIDPYFAAFRFNANVTNPTGWEITGWIDEATGEAAEFNENGQYILSGIKTKSASLVAVYELIEYNIAFNLKNMGNPDILLMNSTVTLGEEIVIDGASFTLNGKEVVLPEAGDSKDTLPADGYFVAEGYTFNKWTYSNGSAMVDATFPIVLTEEIIKINFIEGAVRFTAEWEAKEYNLKFFIINADGNEEFLKEHTVKVGESIVDYKALSDEARAEINAKAPEGKVFSGAWINRETNKTDSMTQMPAKDVEYIASYNSAAIKVYLDLNNLATPDLTQTLELFKTASPTYGQDITEVKSEAPYYERSFKTVVERTLITTEEPSEIIAWNIYHVDSGDVYDQNNWEDGVNDDGTNIATTTLIFQPVWMAHKDMFYRFYDTSDNIYFAVGKDLSLHYWNSGVIVDKYSDTVINTDKENYIVLFFTIEIDWANFSVRFEAFPIPKYVFTLEGMLGIFEMLGNLLGSL